MAQQLLNPQNSTETPFQADRWYVLKEGGEFVVVLGNHPDLPYMSVDVEPAGYDSTEAAWDDIRTNSEYCGIID